MKNNSNILNVSGFIDIGDICNAKCYFCFNNEGPLYYSKEHIFSEIDKYINDGIVDIRYGVGEFTMHPNFFEILEYGYKKGLKQYIHTNGIKLSDENFVKKIKFFGIDNINISLHGIKSKTHDKITQVKGSFFKIIKGISFLKDNKINISLSFVITKDNIDEILGIYLFSIKNNISLLKFSILNGNQRYPDIIPKLGEIKKEISKVLILNRKFGLNVKLLNIPYCLIDIDSDYIFENSQDHLLNDKGCENCDKKNVCSGFPDYYNFGDYLEIIKNYVENKSR